MDAAERQHLILQLRDGHRAVSDALIGASNADLDRRPGPGCWTAREVAHHLADSEATAYIRLRRLLAEDDPTIYAYDENEFSRRLHYERPIEASLDVVRAVRTASADLLDSLDPGEWERAGTHSESGTYSVEGWLEIYAHHAQDHADQIRRARRGEA